MEIMGIKSFAPLSEGMHANAPIVKELMIVRQLFVKNFYAGFHENVANGLAADTRTWFPHKSFFNGSYTNTTFFRTLLSSSD
jgi:hypothetical protein